MCRCPGYRSPRSTCSPAASSPSQVQLYTSATSQPQYASIFRHSENAPTSTFSLCLLVLEESMKQTCIYLKLGHLSAKILTFNLSHCRGQQVQLPAQRAVRHLDPADPLHPAARPGRVPVPSQHGTQDINVSLSSCHR